MDVINLYLLPPILKMIQWSNLSAEGKTCLNSAKLLNSVFCTILNQRINAVWLSGCFSQNWISVLRVMMCMDEIVSQIEIINKGNKSPFNQFVYLLHHTRQIPHNLIIPKADT